MNELHVWYIMIFSIPFLPAIIIFFLIKPKAGDAKVIGGGIPFFKDLKIELAGSIGTYFIIVILGVMTYLLITKDEAISIRILPTSPNGETIAFEDVNKLKLDTPVVHVSPSNKKFKGRATLSNFRLNTSPFEFTSGSPFYVSKALINENLKIKIEGGSMFKSADFTKPTRKEMVVKAPIKADFMSDWLALYDRFGVKLDLSKNQISIKRFTLVYDNSSEGMTKMKLGALSVSGLREARLSVYMANIDPTGEIFNRVDNILDDSESEDKYSRLNEWENDAEDLFDLVDQSIWKNKSKTLFNPNVTGSTYANSANVARFLFAPSPRVRLKSPNAGSVYAIVQETVQDFPGINAKRLDDPLSVDTLMGTKRFVASATILTPDMEFQVPGVSPSLDSQSSHVKILSKNETLNADKLRALWLKNVPKGARINFPMELRGELKI